MASVVCNLGQIMSNKKYQALGVIIPSSHIKMQVEMHMVQGVCAPHPAHHSICVVTYAIDTIPNYSSIVYMFTIALDVHVAKSVLYCVCHEGCPSHNVQFNPHVTCEDQGYSFCKGWKDWSLSVQANGKISGQNLIMRVAQKQVKALNYVKVVGKYKILPCFHLLGELNIFKYKINALLEKNGMVWINKLSVSSLALRCMVRWHSLN